MKKTTIAFAAVAAALMALASCQKEETPSFDRNGELVFTGTIGQDTRTSIDASTGKVSWVSGDEITITDAASTSVKYTVSAIDAQGKATFTKKSGESGSLGDGPYTAVYGTAPATAQTYSASAPALPMSAPSTNTTDLTFTVTCGLIEFTITQTGESIKKISISDNAETPNTYTLNCGNGVSIASGAQFYIAVPAGTYTSCQLTNGTDVVRGRTGFSIAVAANQIQPISTDFAPKYTSGTTDADYGIKVGSKWWAPVNCGYDADHKYGLLYQWSRKYGQPYEITPTFITTQASSIADGNTDANKDKFYSDNTNKCWYSGNTISDTWDQTNYNPCPTGWRVPTNEEFKALLGGKTSKTSIGGLQTDTRSGSATYNMTGLIFDYTPTKKPTDGLFLPAAGYRAGYGFNKGNVFDRDAAGSYWSSSPYSGDAVEAISLDFTASIAYTTDNLRVSGYSVRCIKE